MVGIVFSIEICTLHRITSKNIDLNICAHTWHSVLLMGHKQGFDLAAPELLKTHWNVDENRKKYCQNRTI